MHPIKSDPGLRICQVRGPLFYTLGGLRYSSQYPN